MSKIFIAQFVTIYLLGFQQLNVTGKHYLAAILTSLALGISGFYTVGIIAEISLAAQGTLIWFVYLLAGPLAIVSAMYTHPIIKRKFYG